MVKRLFFAVLLIALSNFSYTQEVKEVTLVVNGEGITKEDATNVALRSAIEQAFGVFVSANTTILNDELVRDEIATVSSGNIQKYTELGCNTLPNGNTLVSLEATVSIGKLVSYVKSKGAECEFAGATLGANAKLIRLKYQNGVTACNNLIDFIKTYGPEAFDYRLDIMEPQLEEKTSRISGYISIDTNKNTRDFCLTVARTLMSIRFSEKEVNFLTSLDGNKKFDNDSWGNPNEPFYYHYVTFHKEKSISLKC